MFNKKNTYKYMANILGLLILMGTLSACNLLPKQDTKTSAVQEAKIVTAVGAYDSLDDAIFVSLNSEEGSIRFQNMETGKFYTLQYDGASTFVDKYEEAISPMQLMEGDMVRVAFRKTAKQLTSLIISEDAWGFTDVNNFRIDESKKSISIGQTVYQLADNAIVLSGGKAIEFMDINQKDVLTIRGIDKTVYSIQVQKGHGYVKLENYEAVIGGFLEFGNRLILPIQEQMLYVVPEGSYQVVATFGKNKGIYPLEILRDQEYTLDLSSVIVEETVYTSIDFQLTPADATLTIDGLFSDVTEGIHLAAGLHQILVEKEGYESVSQLIRVGTTSSLIEITLEQLDEEEELSDEEEQSEEDETDTTIDDNEDTTENEVTSETDTTTETETSVTLADYKIWINLPEKVEVYVDGIYIGITPISYVKKTGNQVITLRKTGYQTRSYTISVGEELKDATYTFPDLILQGDS